MDIEKAQKIVDEAGVSGTVTHVGEDVDNDGVLIAVLRDDMNVAGPTGTTRIYINIEEEKIVGGDSK